MSFSLESSPDERIADALERQNEIFEEISKSLSFITKSKK